MRKLIILAAFAACCLAAPSGTNKDNKEVLLQRPSPINPDVPMEPKPAEKITVITDPKEIAKYKRETDSKKEHAPVVPTVSSSQYHVTETQSLDHKHENNADNKYVHRTDDVHDHRAKRDSGKEIGKHDHEHTQKSVDEHEDHADHEHAHKAENKHDDVKHRVKRDSVKSSEKHDTTKVQPLVSKPVQKPATTSKPKATAPTTPKQSPTNTKHEAVRHRQKRDVEDIASTSTAAVPVNLGHKSENGAPQVDSVVTTSSSTDVLPSLVHKNESDEPNVDASEHKHSAQEPQVRPQILPAFLPVGAEVNPHALSATLTVKRDIPVPLVPKHHHPEESPRDDDKKSEEKKVEDNKPANEEPNIHAIKKDDVQVEDLSGSVPLHHPKPVSLEQQHNTQQNSEQLSGHHHNNQNSFIHHEQQDQPHFQPQHPHVASHQAEVAAHEKETNQVVVSTTTSTEHPVLRHKPVPVAELFARQEQQ